MTQQTSFFPLNGGMDLVTPPLAMPPGRVIAALNYEPVAAGYRRLRGFERFDGRTAPSEALAYQITYDANGTGNNVSQLLLNDAIRDTSGGTIIGYAAANAVLTSGTWGTPTAVGTVKVFIPPANLAAWVDNNEFFVGATRYGYQQGSTTALTSASDQQLAATQARGLITAVPGSGPVRGVWLYDGQILAFRDDAGGSFGIMHKATSSGWQTVAIAEELAFTSGGTAEIETIFTYQGDEASTLVTGATSGALANVRGVLLTSGSWAGGDAAGTLLVTGRVGNFVAENLDYRHYLQGGGTQLIQANAATVAANAAAVTLQPGGRYEFVNHNFYGMENRHRMYGVNGVNHGFEFDGVSLALILVSGVTEELDKPEKIAVHKQSLFLGYDGGSVQFSVVGEPTTFNAVLGAGEIGIGCDIADFMSTSGALVILGAGNISVLYGNDSSDYQLEVLTNEAGGLPHTTQRVGEVYYMDNVGIRGLSSSQRYGNFSIGTVSRLIEPLLEDYRHDGVEPVGSLVSRHDDQLWYFFSNGTGLIVYFGKKNPEILPFNLGKVISCCCSVEDDGEERMFLGTTDGFVYELDKGTSFDGSAIEHYVRLPFNHFGRPQHKKLIKRVLADIEAHGTTTISLTAEYDLGSVPGSSTQAAVLTTGGGAIDSLGSNEQYYASQIETQAEVYLDGLCLNISLKIGGNTSTEEPHTLTGITYHVLLRGMDT